jgi:SAM-dependent methyltransferase
MDEAVYQRMAEVQATHWWYAGRRRILDSVISGLGLPQNALILEAGCGTGANLEILKKYGQVEGFEPFDFAAAKAAELSGCTVKSGLLPDGIPFNGPYDLIGAFDVIEHVEPDLESLKALLKITKQGGYGIFTVPAFPFLWSRHDEVNHHFRRYRRHQFQTLLEQAGYQVELISYYNFFLFPAVVAVRAMKKLLRIKDTPDEALPKLPSLNTALKTLFSAERILLKAGSLPFGVSIIAVGRKP